MGLFGKFISGKSSVGGEIAYYGLAEWWNTTLTDSERSAVLSEYRANEGRGTSLIEGKISNSSQSRLGFLTNLVSWFDNPRGRGIALKIVDEAERGLRNDCDVLDLHFFFATKLKLFYKLRDDDTTALQTAIAAAESQVALADQAARQFKRDYPKQKLPTHTGYEQLCIIREKQRDYAASIELAEAAKKQKWNGDWDKRIERCRGRQSNK